MSLLTGVELAASSSPHPECPNPLWGTPSLSQGTRDIGDPQGGMLGGSRDPLAAWSGPWGTMVPAPVTGGDVPLPSRVCVLAPLLFLPGLLPLSPLNSLINISPRTALRKLLCRRWQGMGAQVQVGLG